METGNIWPCLTAFQHSSFERREGRGAEGQGYLHRRWLCSCYGQEATKQGNRKWGGSCVPPSPALAASCSGLHTKGGGASVATAAARGAPGVLAGMAHSLSSCRATSRRNRTCSVWRRTRVLVPVLVLVLVRLHRWLQLQRLLACRR